MAEGKESMQCCRAVGLGRRLGLGLIAAAAVLLAASSTAISASPTVNAISLQSAAGYAVLAGTAITNQGPSSITGDVGAATATVTGLSLGTVDGAIGAATPAVLAAHQDLAAAYDAAVNAPCTVDKTGQNLGGQTLAAGSYCQSTAPTLSGTLTLSGPGVFIFQIGSTFVSAPGARIVLNNGANACNVYWQVGSSATVGSGAELVGTIMAHTAITSDDLAHINGRLLAVNGQVTLVNDTATLPTCTTTLTSTPVASPSAPPAVPALLAAPVAVAALGACSLTSCSRPNNSARPLAIAQTGPSAVADLPPSVSPPPSTVEMPPASGGALQMAVPPVESAGLPWIWPALVVVNLCLLLALVALSWRTRESVRRRPESP